MNALPDPSLNIVLTGFMGTGKTSVGRVVAARLGRPFLDMDVEIEARAGKTISAIFAEDGEAVFRRMEAELCRELSARQADAPAPVIATGGGALVNAAYGAENRRRMIASGPVFCLSCDVDVLLSRLAPAQDRPLLDVDDRRTEAEALLSRRREAYATLPRQIDTTDLAVDEVADRVIDGARSILLPVHTPSGSYPIHVGPGLLAHLGALVRETLPAARQGPIQIAVVTNPTVAGLYLAPVLGSLEGAGLAPLACTMPDGEEHKTLETLAGLYDQFVAGGLDRGGAVLALGGGVTCDVAGFAAATYMRGVPVIQAPTTLLAMVDASVGGKTAVDRPQAKNLVGAFVQPALVVIDSNALDTLPPAELASGMAELIKHGVLADAELFEELEQAAPALESWSRWIARSLQVKIDVVEQDPYERGWRAVLNLGHTAGHALEQVSGFRLRHGEGVSMGMVVAARIAVETGRAEAGLPERIARALAAHHLPIRCPPVGAEAAWEAMGRDKKKRGGQLRWVLPRAIGEIEIVDDVPREVVLNVLREMGAA
jgi:shikimate kinase/3-dehydroquinate synthase